MDTSSTIFLGLGAVVAVLGVAAYSMPSKPSDAFADVCDAAFKERLVAPTTYKRQSTLQIHIPVVDIAYYETWLREEDRYYGLKAAEVDRPNRNRRREQILSAPSTVAVRSLLIKYQATNAYGVPIRNSFRCDDIVFDGRPSSENSVRIDGKSNLMLMVEQARNAKQ